MMKKYILTLFMCIITQFLWAQFRISTGNPINVACNPNEKNVVWQALELFKRDYRNVFSDSVRISESQGNIIVSTMGKNNPLMTSLQVDLSSLEGKKQGFMIKVLPDSKLLVVGSDRHGTAYGIMELSRMIGVSPWEWWADVTPRKRDFFELPENFEMVQSPSVEYRGIFINDEDWGLMQWSSLNYEPWYKSGRIGPRTNERIFELMLRLRANYYWPAMHECTEPFFLTEGNRGQSLARVQSITEVPAKDTADRDTDAMQTDVSFEHVTFAYPNKKDSALCDVNLQFPKGSHAAIVGESGSGKSTLASLMMGFWQPQSGTVRLGGESLAELSERNIADFFSMVQQEVFLFNTSIRDNIRIGKPSATQEEVEMAARRARIHDFIVGLPNGYDTSAGEAGVKFSGGEKQRISIARMLLKDSPIVILDEATAALDGENEKLIQEALDELQRNKTVITIAHRLNTIQEVERIVVMDKGQVVATGTHGELMDNCPLYRNMTETQERVSKWQLKEEEV